MKRALITGITGQDGSYLAELLLAKGYAVTGVIRKRGNAEQGVHSLTESNIECIRSRVTLVDPDLLDRDAVLKTMREIMPDELYHLAAKTFVPSSHAEAQAVIEFAERSTAHLLDALRDAHPSSKFFHAASAEIFGNAQESPQTETTSFHPRSPYGEAKVVGHELTKQARERLGMFAVSGILFNHESPRRGLKFVTRKITRGAAAIKLGQTDTLELGDLEARRDWGYAPEYVEAMWRMLQADDPQDFVIATGQTHSVREFCELAFGELDLDYKKFVRFNPEFARGPEAAQLVGNPAKAKLLLEWEAQLPFPELVSMMAKHDLAILRSSSRRSE